MNENNIIVRNAKMEQSSVQIRTTVGLLHGPVSNIVNIENDQESTSNIKGFGFEIELVSSS